MVVKVIKSNYVGGNQRVLDTFDNMESALNYMTKRYGKMPLQVDKFTFLLEVDNDMIFTEIENFYQFKNGDIVQTDLNNSPYRFTDAKVIQCFANGFYPNYMVRLQDETVRIVREKDIRIQRLQ
jgi:hypothetical protein